MIKKIIHFIDKRNGDIHCYFEEEVKYNYSEKNFQKIIREHDWAVNKLKELKKILKEGDYFKITNINFEKQKTIEIVDSSKIDEKILKMRQSKTLFNIEIINKLSKELFDYYFDKSFYKNINQPEDEEKQTSQMEEVIEKYMQKTKQLLLTREKSTSIKELFNGQSKTMDKIPPISFIHPRFNLSQFEAVEKSLTQPTTIIKGPPGTGKTTTLLNIIISAFLNGKTVLVSSKNNKAVDNVMESLEEYDFEKFWFRFGSKKVINKELENTQTFSFKKNKNSIYSTNNLYQDLKKLVQENSIQKNIEDALIQWKSLKINFENKIKEKKINPLFSEKITIPKRKFDNNFLNILLWFMLPKKNKKAINKLNKIVNDLYISKNNSQKLIKEENFEEVAKQLKEDSFCLENFNFIIKMITFNKNKKTNINFDSEWSKIKDNDKYYDGVKNDIEKHISANSDKRGKVVQQINAGTMGSEFNFWEEFKNKKFLDDFMKSFPIHFVTNLSIFNLPDVKYDYVILDEAGQSDIQSTLGLLQKGKHNILCGDEKQLEPIYNMTREFDNQLAEKYGVDPFLRAHNNSLLNIYSGFFTEDRISFLNEHYRCPPEVVRFSNAMFYNDKLKIMTKNKNNDKTISMIEVEGKVESDKWVNQDEISAIIKDFKTSGFDQKQVAIISPFRDQINALKARKELKGIAIDTVHRFQGREFDRIYFSTVLGSRMGKQSNNHLNKESLINVALTRTKKSFVLVSNKKQIQEKSVKYNISKNKNKSPLIVSLQKYIFDEEYKKLRNTKEDISMIWKENIKNNTALKSFVINPLFELLSSFCKKEKLKLAINVRYPDIFEINTNNENFFSQVDYVVYSSDGKVQLAIINKKIVYENNLEDKIDFLKLAISKPDLKIKNILTVSEIKFQKMLENIISKDEIIMPTVKLSSIIDLNKQNNLSDWLLKSAKSMHFDFVIYKKENNALVPIKVIELDDQTHTNERVWARDKRKNGFASLAGIKIKRFISYKY